MEWYDKQKLKVLIQLRKAWIKGGNMKAVEQPVECALKQTVTGEMDVDRGKAVAAIANTHSRTREVDLKEKEFCEEQKRKKSLTRKFKKIGCEVNCPQADKD